MERYLNLKNRRDVADEMIRVSKKHKDSTGVLFTVFSEYLEKLSLPFSLTILEKTSLRPFHGISLALRKDGPLAVFSIGHNKRDDGSEVFRDFRKGLFDPDTAKQDALKLCKEFDRKLKYSGRMGPMEDIFFILCGLINRGYDPVHCAESIGKRCNFVLVRGGEYICINISKKLTLDGA
jgi:hypothetical protein